MSDSTADTINSVGAFVGGAGFGAALSGLLTYPADCSSVLGGGDCKTLIGTYVLNEGQAAGASLVVGLVLGGICAAIAGSINDRHTREAQEARERMMERYAND